MINFVFAFLLSQNAYAQLELRIADSGQIYKPGSIVDATIIANGEVNVSQISPVVLKDGIDKKIFLIFSTSPWEKNSEGWKFDAKLVLGPEFLPSNRVEISNSTNQYISTPDIKWDGSIGEIPSAYVYNDQELFSINWFVKNKYLTGFVASLFLVILSYYGNLYLKKIKTKKNRKIKMSNMVKEVEMADDLVKLSEVWRQRDSYKEQFINKNKSIDEFFAGLNQIQFKPRVESDELKKVLIKKEVLLSELREELSGV